MGVSRFTDERLDALAGAYGLAAAQREALTALLELTASDAHAPTAVTDPAEAVDAHLADSLVALDLEVVRSAGVIADLGSGPGFPGLPLAVALPDAHVFLVEAARRKVAFLERAVAATGVRNAEAVHARAEEWRDGLDRCAVVTARAVDALPVLVEYAAPLLRIGGALVAWKGRRDPDEEAAGAGAAAQLGLRPAEIVPVQPFPAARERHLHVFVKEGPTPAGYPRAPGRARKRPLR